MSDHRFEMLGSRLCVHCGRLAADHDQSEVLVALATANDAASSRKRPTRQKPPKPPGEAKPPRTPRPTYASTHQTVGVMIPTALMDRLAVVEARYGYRAVSLSALITATLEQWLDELERRLDEVDPS